MRLCGSDAKWKDRNRLVSSIDQIAQAVPQVQTQKGSIYHRWYHSFCFGHIHNTYS